MSKWQLRELTQLAQDWLVTKRMQTQCSPSPRLDPDPFCMATVLAHGGGSQGPVGYVGLSVSVLLMQAFGGTGWVPSGRQPITLQLASDPGSLLVSCE